MTFTVARSAEDASDFSEQLAALWRGFGEIAKGPNWTPQQDEGYIRRIEDSITGYVIERLNSRLTPSAETLELELNKATTQAFDGLSFEAVREQNPGWQGFAHVLQTSYMRPSLYIVAVTVGPGNTPSNLIRAFSSRNGRYESVASAGEDFKNRRLQLFMMKPFEPDEIRFLISGLCIGSPEGLTNLVLYSFDGQRLRVVWQRDSVPNAEISLVGRNITISSYEPIPNKRPWVSTLETYAQVPTGLKLLKVEHGTVQ
ncbi:MAG TPA: hypothetical protein VIX19_13795 [Terriglobales bacterium]